MDRAVDEVVPVCAAEMVTTMTVPFTTLVTPWADVVVPAGEVTADVRVRVTFVGVPDSELDTAVSEADEADEGEAPVEEVAFQPREDDWVGASDAGLVTVVPIDVSVTVEMIVPFTLC